tara:strand:+ start:426 stop:722 length:297 start_codon:yes stop_codon:yes gene_type:complete
MDDVILTNHAKKRFKERVGLPKRAIQRYANMAFSDGVCHGDVSGGAHRYLTCLFFKKKTATSLRVYGGFVYIFNGTTLITVHDLPQKYRKTFITEGRK